MSNTQETTPLRSQSHDKTKKNSLGHILSTPQRWTGFKTTLNFYLFLLTAAVFAGFCLVRSSSVHHPSWLHRTELHRFWYSEGSLALWMSIHLKTVIPAGMLMPFQFLPAIRQRYPKFHRYGGRLNFVLLLIANISALFIAPKAFGGTVDTRIAVVFMAVMTTFSLIKSWTAIRNVQIDQHRVWVLRTWSYVGGILTLRICIAAFAVGTQIISPNVYKRVMTCQEVLFLYTTQGLSLDSPLSRYPQCANATVGGEPMDVIVTAALGPNIEQVNVMLSMCFGVAAWAGLLINSLAVEIYLNYTTSEDERLKKVSELRRKAVKVEAASASQ